MELYFNKLDGIFICKANVHSSSVSKVLCLMNMSCLTIFSCSNTAAKQPLKDKQAKVGQ